MVRVCDPRYLACLLACMGKNHGVEATSICNEEERHEVLGVEENMCVFGVVDCLLEVS